MKPHACRPEPCLRAALVLFALGSPAAGQGTFHLEQKLVHLPTAGTPERLGTSCLYLFGDDLELSGSMAAVRAAGHDFTVTNEKHRPAVFVLEDVGGAWAPVAELRPPQGALDHRAFGASLDLEDDTLVVGSPSVRGEGEVYVYRREPETGNWLEVARLVSPMPVPSFYGFGYDVALSANTLAIGEPIDDDERGWINVFERQPGTEVWQLTQRIQLPLPHHSLGRSLDLHGDTLVAWAWGSSNSTQGRLHVLERNGSGGWQEQVSFFTNSGGLTHISVGDDRFVWSEPGAGPFNPAGEADVFEKDVNGAWTIFTSLPELVHPLINTTTHRLGSDCAIDGDTVVLGGQQVTAGLSSTPLGGAAYVFRRSASGAWSLAQTLRVPGPTFDDGFGDPVVLDGNVFFVGARTDDDIGTWSGSVFTFRRP